MLLAGGLARAGPGAVGVSPERPGDGPSPSPPALGVEASGPVRRGAAWSGAVRRPGALCGLQAVSPSLLPLLAVLPEHAVACFQRQFGS